MRIAGHVSRTRLALVAILIVALSIRIAYVMTSENNAYKEDPRAADIAHNLIDGGRWFYLNEPAMISVFNEENARRRPVEPNTIDYAALNRGVKLFPEVAEPVGSAAVLAAVWEIVGSERYLPMQILQAIVDALATLLVYRIAMQLFRRNRAALAAAALYALYLPIAWQTIVVYNDIWAVDFTLVVVATFLQARNSSRRRWRWLVLCGVLAGLGAYFRPAVLLLPAAIALASIPQPGWRTELRRGISVVAIAALLLVPWTIRNYEDFHAFIPTRSSFWENMWYGLGERPNDFGATEDVGGTLRREIERSHPDLRFESPAWDDFLKPRVVSALESHPLYYLELLARRTAAATIFVFQAEWMRRAPASPLRYPGGPIAFVRYVITRPLDLLEDAFQPLIFLLAMIAMAGTWRRFRRRHMVMIAIALSCLVPYIVIHVAPRYILPADFTYCIWVGLGADLLIERLMSRKARGRHELSRRHRDIRLVGSGLPSTAGADPQSQ